MKKIFLAAVMAMSLCSYSFAQDDDDEYEEDSPRAAAVETSSQSQAAPAKAKVSREEGGSAFMGVSLDLLGLFDGDLRRFGLVFRLGENMELTAHFGLNIVGDQEGEDQQGNKQTGPEGGTQIALGAGFDFFFDMALPASIGGDLLFTHWGEDNNQLDFDVMFGVRAEIVKNFTINGKVGFDIAYHWWTDGNVDWDRVDFGIATRVNFIWFFI